MGRSKSYVLYIDNIPKNFNFGLLLFSPKLFQTSKTGVFYRQSLFWLQKFTIKFWRKHSSLNSTLSAGPFPAVTPLRYAQARLVVCPAHHNCRWKRDILIPSKNPFQVRRQHSLFRLLLCQPSGDPVVFQKLQQTFFVQVHHTQYHHQLEASAPETRSQVHRKGFHLPHHRPAGLKFSSARGSITNAGDPASADFRERASAPIYECPVHTRW